MLESTNPYVAPKAPEAVAATTPRPTPAKRRLSALKWLVAAAALFAATLGALTVFAKSDLSDGVLVLLGVVGFLAAAVMAMVGFVRSLGGLGARGPQSALAIVAGLGLAVANLAMAGLGALAAFAATVSTGRGRQLRRAGRLLLAPVTGGGSWAGLALPPGRAGGPDGLGEQWRENGRTEHASVAAFARLTLDLMALGAPAALITAANQDALDEIRHAELCFSLARALDGKVAGPGAFPEAQRARTLPRRRSLALATLAVDSLVDGALHEGTSARLIARLARRCGEPAIAELLKEIAADEGRHAAHGWDVVRFCLDEGGASVGHALLGALRALPVQMRSSLPAAAAGGAWEHWGIPGAALEREAYAATRAQLIERVDLMVAPLVSGTLEGFQTSRDGTAAAKPPPSRRV